MDEHSFKTIADEHGIALIYLFGSEAETGYKYLLGEEVFPDPLSDLDVAVGFITPPAQPMETYGQLYREFSELFPPFNLDLVFLHEVNPLFQLEIIRGFRIFAREGFDVDRFEEEIMRRSEDLFFKRRLLEREIMEAIEDGYFEFEYHPNP